MMKTLVLVRHAKSSWDNPAISDIERPLNKRGERDAPKMANIAKELGIMPDIIYSSPAIRALSTGRIFSGILNYKEENIVIEKDIYFNGLKSILSLLSNTDDSLNCVLFFGHNPDIYRTAEILASFTGDYPTCGVLCIDFNIQSWGELGEKAGKIRFFEYPKKYSK